LRGEKETQKRKKNITAPMRGAKRGNSVAIINKCLTCGNEIKTYPSQNKKYCNLDCRDKAYTGKKHTEKHRRNISKALKRKCRHGYMPKNVFKRGEDHPFWAKDRSKIQFIETPEYQEFRVRILKRDNYQCQECGVRGKKGTRPVLHIHHLKPRKNFPKLSLVESNVVVLCKECHKKTDSYLKRWEDFTGQKAELCGQ